MNHFVPPQEAFYSHILGYVTQIGILTEMWGFFFPSALLYTNPDRSRSVMNSFLVIFIHADWFKSTVIQHFKCKFESTGWPVLSVSTYLREHDSSIFGPFVYFCFQNPMCCWCVVFCAFQLCICSTSASASLHYIHDNNLETQLASKGYSTSFF